MQGHSKTGDGTFRLARKGAAPALAALLLGGATAAEGPVPSTKSPPGYSAVPLGPKARASAM